MKFEVKDLHSEVGMGSVTVDRDTGKIVGFEGSSGIDATRMVGTQPYGTASKRCKDKEGRDVYASYPAPSSPASDPGYDFALQRALGDFGLSLV